MNPGVVSVEVARAEPWSPTWHAMREAIQWGGLDLWNRIGVLRHAHGTIEIETAIPRATFTASTLARA